MKNNAQQELPPALMSTSSNRIIKWAKRIFTPLALGFLVYFGWQSRAILTTIFANAEIYYLGLAILIWIINHFVIAMATVMILKTSGAIVPYKVALTAHIEHLPARYIPGGIWHTVGRMMNFYTYGVKPAHLTTFFLLENTIVVGIAFLVGGAFVWYFRGMADIWGKIAILAFICSLLGLTIVPFVLNYWQVLKSVSQVSYRCYLQTIAIYLPIWFLLTFAFIMYLSAFSLALGDISMLEIGGTYMFSWGIGFVAIIAPQGIGIVEIVAGNILDVPMSLSNLAVLIAGFRIIALIADIVLWSLMRWKWLSYK